MGKYQKQDVFSIVSKENRSEANLVTDMQN